MAPSAEGVSVSLRPRTNQEVRIHGRSRCRGQGLVGAGHARELGVVRLHFRDFLTHVESVERFLRSPLKAPPWDLNAPVHSECPTPVSTFLREVEGVRHLGLDTSVHLETIRPPHELKTPTRHILRRWLE